jgi:hypothetical protein
MHASGAASSAAAEAAATLYLQDDGDASELRDGNPLRIFHLGAPLCFDLDHFVHKQVTSSDDFLSQSICLSQSIFRITVQEVRCTAPVLMNFYSKRNPEKCADVPTIVQKYAGNLPTLLAGLRAKYGTPELNPSEVGARTVWRLQSTMSGTYLTSVRCVALCCIASLQQPNADCVVAVAAVALLRFRLASPRRRPHGTRVRHAFLPIPPPPPPATSSSSSTTFTRLRSATRLRRAPPT